MTRKWPDLLLILAIAAGGILAWQSGRERSRLADTFGRLTQKTGDLAIADPSKIHLKALETREPLHFAWRVYLPPNARQYLKYSSGGMGSSTSTQARELIARVRLREDEAGILQVYTHFSGGSSQSSLGDRTLADLLRDRWERVIVEQIGTADLAVVEPDAPAILLRLTLPEDIQREAREKASPHVRSAYVPLLFELELNPKTSKP